MPEEVIHLGEGYCIHDFDQESGCECNYRVVVHGPVSVKGIPVSIIEVRLPPWHLLSQQAAEVFFVLARPATEEEERGEENNFLEWQNGARLRKGERETSMKFVKKEGMKEVWPETLSDAYMKVQEVALHPDLYPALFGLEGVIGFEFPPLDFVLCRTCAIETYPEALREAIAEVTGIPRASVTFLDAKRFALYATDPSAHLLYCHLLGCEKALVGPDGKEKE